MVSVWRGTINNHQIEIKQDGLSIVFYKEGIEVYRMSDSDNMLVPSDLYDAIDKWGGCVIVIKALMLYINNANGKVMYKRQITQQLADGFNGMVDGNRVCRETTHLLNRIRKV